VGRPASGRPLEEKIVQTFKIVDQIVVGNRVFGVGEVVELSDEMARHVVDRRAAVEYVPPVPPVEVREAVSVEPAQARRATRKGN